MPEATASYSMTAPAEDDMPATADERGTRCCTGIGATRRCDQRQRVGVTLAAAIISVTLHAAAAYALLFYLSIHEMEGAGGEYEGISVELVAGTAVESVAGASREQAAAADARVNDASGEDAPKDQAALNATDAAPREKSETAIPETINSNAPPEIAAEPKPEKTAEQTVPDATGGEGKEEVKQPEQASLVMGGAASSGASQTAVSTEASVAASPGEMSRYAAGLHAAIIRNRPHHAGHGGSVTVLFSLSQTGELRNAEVVKSSGDAHLEHLALAAIRSVHFPAPPSRANKSQLRYTTTIKFR